MGFNGAEVVHFIDCETFEDLIEVVWGDQRLMRLPRMRTPCSWAISYSEEDPCIRTPKRLVLPRVALSESCNELDKRFTEALLEAIPC